MEIVSEVIWTMECSTGSGQEVHGEEAQKDRDQSGFLPEQVEGNKVVYQCREPSFHYQAVILSNNQVEVSVT